jgi:hypothetical protein
VYCDGISGLLDAWYLPRHALKAIKPSTFMYDLVFMAVTTKNAFFWDVVLCGFIITVNVTLFQARIISNTVKIEVTRSSKTLVYNRPTQRHIPEDGIQVLLVIATIVGTVRKGAW